MVIFTLILIIFSPFIIKLTNQNKQNNFVNFGKLFIPLFIFQYILSPYTYFQKITFQQYSIISFIIFLLLILSVISLIIYRIIRCEENSFLFKNFKSSLVLTVLIFISVMFIIFTKYTSANTNNDLNYYINISKNFQYGIFGSTSNINQNINGQIQIFETSNYYLVPQMFFVYGSLFKDNIAFSYNILNTTFYITLLLFLSNNIYVKFIKNNNTYIKSLYLFCCALISISTLYVNVNSGNLAMQSLVLIMLLVNFLCIKEINLYSFIPFLSLSFFSPTGVLLGLIPIIVILVYYSVKNNFFYVIKYLPLLLLIMIYNILTFTSLFSFVFFLVIYYFVIIASFAWYFVFIFFIKKKNMNLSFSSKFSNFEKYKNIIFYVSLIFILVTISFTLFNNLWYQTYIANKNHSKTYFEKNYSFLYLAISLFLLGCYIFMYKKGKINIFILFVFVINFLSTVELMLGSTIKYSGSMWRLIYLIPGMGNISDTILLILLFILFSWENIFSKFVKFKDIEKIKLKNSKFFIRIILFIPIFLASLFTILSSYTSIFNSAPINMTFDKNVTQNLFFVSNNDRKKLENIDFNDWSYSYITDLPIYQYLNSASDLTSFLMYDLNDDGKIESISESYHWNYLNFYKGIDYWNNISNIKLDKNPETILDRINNLLDSSQLSKLKLTINNKTINELNYIILNKQTPYFSYIYSKLSSKMEITNGDNIVIMKVKNA